MLKAGLVLARIHRCRLRSIQSTNKLGVDTDSLMSLSDGQWRSRHWKSLTC